MAAMALHPTNAAQRGVDLNEWNPKRARRQPAAAAAGESCWHRTASWQHSRHGDHCVALPLARVGEEAAGGRPDLCRRGPGPPGGGSGRVQAGGKIYAGAYSRVPREHSSGRWQPWCVCVVCGQEACRTMACKHRLRKPMPSTLSPSSTQSGSERRRAAVARAGRRSGVQRPAAVRAPFGTFRPPPPPPMLPLSRSLRAPGPRVLLLLGAASRAWALGVLPRCSRSQPALLDPAGGRREA